MPKSKRSRVVSLTNTDKAGREAKEGLVEEIQKCLDDFASVYVFSVENMRNSKIKDVRQEWRHSRFFYGKNRIMGLALGRTAEEEVRPNLHLVTKALSGNVGLLFTNKDEAEVTKWFGEYSNSEFARSGNVASQTVTVAAGELPQFSHAMEPQLRKLGLPTALKKGIVTLLSDHTICTAGETLTPEQARLLKLFEYQMMAFRIALKCSWDARTNEFKEYED